MTQDVRQRVLTATVPNRAGGTMRILVVDDEETIRCTLGLFLETLGHEVQAVATAGEAVGAASRGLFDAAFVDIRLGVSSGLDLMMRLLALNRHLKVIVITAYATVDIAVDAMTRGATDFLCKPFAPEQIGAVMQRVADLVALESGVGAWQDRSGTAGPAGDFATTSAALQEAIGRARQAAPGTMAVLISGEAGTGKRVLARAIHGWSGRAHGPCRTISCAEKSAMYVDLALFGESSAGGQVVVADRPTVAAECAGGTLIVAQGQALSAGAQGKLLELVRRPGEVRVVVTVQTGVAAELLPELMEQLAVRMAVPGLRERAGDVPLLAQRYLAYVRETTGKKVLGFSAAALEALQTYAWPGNLHELRTTVAGAVQACATAMVELEDLPEGVREAVRQQKRVPRAGDAVTVRDLEAEHIRAVLASGKSLQEAAAILGLDPQALYRRRKQYGL